MRHLFIVNLVAGNGKKSSAMVARIHQLAKEKELNYEVLYTEYPKHATELVKNQCMLHKDEENRFYAIGGDGTLNEVVAGCYAFSNASATHIPTGTGCDFIKVFGKKEDFLNLEDLIQGETVPIDIIQVNDRICLNAVTIGLDAVVCDRLRKYRKVKFLTGMGAYIASLCDVFFSKWGIKTTFTLNKKDIEKNCLVVVISNGRYYGGGFKMNPNGDVQDGKTEVIIIDKISRLHFLSLVGMYQKGKHVDRNNKVAKRFKDVLEIEQTQEEIHIVLKQGKKEIINVDGECFNSDELTINILPLKCSFNLPKKILS